MPKTQKDFLKIVHRSGAAHDLVRVTQGGFHPPLEFRRADEPHKIFRRDWQVAFSASDREHFEVVEEPFVQKDPPAPSLERNTRKPPHAQRGGKKE